jgi:hypothetical protein
LLAEHRADPLGELGRQGHLVTSALRTEHLLQVPLEIGVTAARVAAAEMPLDLETDLADELSVEVELDLLQHVFAVSR